MKYIAPGTKVYFVDIYFVPKDELTSSKEEIRVEEAFVDAASIHQGGVSYMLRVGNTYPQNSYESVFLTKKEALEYAKAMVIAKTMEYRANLERNLWRAKS